jgi:dTDP-4-amino-4,6-dideoxygalactose transaminase
VDKYTWVDLGSNYLASEIQAAYLLTQLRASDLVQSLRAAIWDRYDAALQDWAGANNVDRPTVPPYCEQPSHLYYLLMPTASARAQLIEHLKAQGILAVFHYVPLNLSPMGRKLGGREGACPVSEDVSERLMRLPFYTNLSVDEQNDVIAAVQQFKV